MTVKSRSGIKEAFCASLAWSLELQWFDRTGYHKLDDERRARIVLETRECGGEYPGFNVTILSKNSGVIDQKYFKFDDYLDTSLEGRTDRRSDYPLRGNTCYEVIAHCGWEFYIAKPKDTRPYTEAVERWIDQFR